MKTRARLLSAIVSFALLVLGVWPLLRPLWSLERWLPPDRLILVATADAALAKEILADEGLRERVLVLASSSASAEVVAGSCRQLAKTLGDRHPSFLYSPESLICRFARSFADDLVGGGELTLFEGFSPVPPGSESEAWARYGLGRSNAGLRVIGRGRRPGLGPGYNREIGY